MQEAFQKSAADDSFQRKIALAKRMFSNLQDGSAGFSGSDLLTRLEAGGLQFLPGGKNQKGYASYRPFVSACERSFYNAITNPLLDPEGNVRSDAEMTGSTFHEIIHADSWDRVPVLHASPFNANTPIILCPEDHALMTVITERVAYANMGWLLSLAQNERLDLSHIVTPVNATAFDFMYTREADLGKALALAGDLSMRVTWGGTDKRDGAKLTMEQFYHWAALDGYETVTEERAKFKDLPLVVRLEPHNILSMGQSFGPNIVELGQSFTSLRPLDQTWVGEIYKKLNKLADVPAYEHLPTFDEGLRRFGYTPESFMEMSKTAGQASAVSVPAPQLVHA